MPVRSRASAQALPTLEAHAPMIANLFTDLLINDRLQRSAELRLAEVFETDCSTRKKRAGSCGASICAPTSCCGLWSAARWSTAS